MSTDLILVVALPAAWMVFSIAYTRPRRLWSLVIAAGVLASGLVIEGASFIDEMLVGAAMVAVLLRPPTASRPDTLGSALLPHRSHLPLFLVTCGYMGGQSLRGLASTHDLPKIRWVLFFLLVAMLAVGLARRRPPLPSRREAAVLLCGSGLAYFVTYVAVGLMNEVFLGGSKYDIQNASWGGTTYAAFAVIVVIPAAVLLLRDRSPRARRLAWVTLALITFQAFYYDSRASWVALIVFIVAAAPVIGVRRTAVFAGTFAAGLWIALTFFFPSYYDIGVFGGILVKPLQVAGGRADSIDFGNFGRKAHTQIGLEILSSEPDLLLAGTGFRASSPIVGAALVRYYGEHGFGRFANSVAGQESTVGASTLLIETGVIGFGLYLANFVMVARAILRRERTRYRYTLLASLGLAGFWMLITNPMDILVLHLMIMPSGLLLLLSSSNERSPTSAPASAGSSLETT